MKTFKLPAELVQPQVSSMQIGEELWTVPWALEVDSHNGIWLRPDFSVHGAPYGTVRLRIKRLSAKEFSAILTGSNYKFVPSNKVPAELEKRCFPITDFKYRTNN